MRVFYAVGFIMVLYSSTLNFPPDSWSLSFSTCVGVFLYFICPSFFQYTFKTSSYIFIMLMIHNNASENPIYKKLFLWSLSKSHLTKLHSLLPLFLLSIYQSRTVCQHKRDWLKGQRMATSIPERSFEALSIGQNFLFNYFNNFHFYF